MFRLGWLALITTKSNYRHQERPIISTQPRCASLKLLTFRGSSVASFARHFAQRLHHSSVARHFVRSSFARQTLDVERLMPTARPKPGIWYLVIPFPDPAIDPEIVAPHGMAETSCMHVVYSVIGVPCEADSNAHSNARPLAANWPICRATATQSSRIRDPARPSRSPRGAPQNQACVHTSTIPAQWCIERQRKTNSNRTGTRSNYRNTTSCLLWHSTSSLVSLLCSPPRVAARDQKR